MGLLTGGYPISAEPVYQAVRDGVRDALTALLAGGYPASGGAIHDAIAAGTRRAVAARLDEYGLPVPPPESGAADVTGEEP